MKSCFRLLLLCQGKSDRNCLLNSFGSREAVLFLNYIEKTVEGETVAERQFYYDGIFLMYPQIEEGCCYNEIFEACWNFIKFTLFGRILIGKKAKGRKNTTNC